MLVVTVPPILIVRLVTIKYIMDVHLTPMYIIMHAYACNDGTQVYFSPEISMHGLKYVFTVLLLNSFITAVYVQPGLPRGLGGGHKWIV